MIIIFFNVTYLLDRVFETCDLIERQDLELYWL